MSITLSEIRNNVILIGSLGITFSDNVNM